jgi:predicted methyltransferase
VSLWRLDHGRRLAGDLDVHLSRLQRFRKLARKIDHKEAVFEGRAGDFHMVGELEAPFKRALSDAAVQIGALGSRFRPAADDVQRAFLELNGKVRIAETSHRELNPEGVVACFFKVVRGKPSGAVQTRGLINHACKPVKADDGAIEWVQIHSCHFMSSNKRHVDRARSTVDVGVKNVRYGPFPPAHGPNSGALLPIDGSRKEGFKPFRQSKNSARTSLLAGQKRRNDLVSNLTPSRNKALSFAKSAGLAALALFALSGCDMFDKTGDDKAAKPSAAGDAIGTLGWAVGTPWRIQPERDQYRHPLQTLSFFGVKNDATVIEISPGAGWYTAILAPYIKEGGGHYIAATFDPATTNPRQKKALDEFKQRFVDHAEIFGTVELRGFSKTSGPLGPDNSADVVLTFRNVHNFMMAGYAEKAFRDFYAVLKPGGILGIEEHRLPEGKEQDPQARTGYVAEGYMKKLAQEAGFEFVESSEINANPKDTADHPFGVWTLPPVLRSSPEGAPEDPAFDHAPYLQIGESDRMTLKFRKPLGDAAPATKPTESPEN